MPVSTVTFTTRPLWGGAVSAALPADYMDASDLRQVPDNQEVFLAADSNMTLVLDILEPPEVDEPVRAHFEQLGEDNSARSLEVLRSERLDAGLVTPHLPRETTGVWGLRGVQEVSKFNEEAADWVVISMLLIRLEQVEADLLITVNEPPEANGAPAVGVAEGPNWLGPILDSAAASLCIHDWSLFG